MSLKSWKLNEKSETLLRQLDFAVHSIQPKKFFTPEKACEFVQPILLRINKVMGVDHTEIYSKLDYETWLESIEQFRKAELLEELKEIFVSTDEVVVLALINAAEFDIEQRYSKNVLSDDSKNQLVSFTLKLVEYVNQGALDQNNPKNGPEKSTVLDIS